MTQLYCELKPFNFQLIRVNWDFTLLSPSLYPLTLCHNLRMGSSLEKKDPLALRWQLISLKRYFILHIYNLHILNSLLFRYLGASVGCWRMDLLSGLDARRVNHTLSSNLEKESKHWKPIVLKPVTENGKVRLFINPFVIETIYDVNQRFRWNELELCWMLSFFIFYYFFFCTQTFSQDKLNF